jgi:hypothetical protein
MKQALSPRGLVKLNEEIDGQEITLRRPKK